MILIIVSPYSMGVNKKQRVTLLDRDTTNPTGADWRHACQPKAVLAERACNRGYHLNGGRRITLLQPDGHGIDATFVILKFQVQGVLWRRFRLHVLSSLPHSS